MHGYNVSRGRADDIRLLRKRSNRRPVRPQSRLSHVTQLVVEDLESRQMLSILPAFPGAEGAGQYATGGRGGDVYFVTNLNDSGAGSLRAGIDSANGPRTILFNVSGTIYLNSNLVINKPNLTIAGQSAPGGGITVAGYRTHIVNTHDVIVQFIRFRPGDTHASSEPDALWVQNSQNVMIDHVTASWSIDETISVTDSTNVTVQWSIISEALKAAGHPKGNHSYGSLINGGDVTYHHNLYASNDSRNPRPQGDTLRFDFVNNVIENPGSRYGYSGEGEKILMNYVGNYGIDGNSTPSNTALFQPDSSQTRIFFQGNYKDTSKNGIIDGTPANSGSRLVDGTYTSVSQRFDLPQVQTTDAPQAYIQVLSRAGASIFRDSVDRRVIQNVMEQRGAIIDSQNEVGGYPGLPSGSLPADSNSDGVPDWYAISKNWNPMVNIAAIVAPNGYTYLENYLHEITAGAYAPPPGQTITISTAYGRGGDATVSENGGSSAVSSGDGQSAILSARYNGSDRNEMIALKFDLTQLKAGSVRDAQLQLTAFRDMGSNEALRLYGVVHDATNWNWNEASANFASTPGLQFDGNSNTKGLIDNQLFTLGTVNAGGLHTGDVLTFSNPNLAIFLNLAAQFEGAAQGGIVTILVERTNTSGSQTQFASSEATQLSSGGIFPAGTFAPRLVIDGTLASAEPEVNGMTLRQTGGSTAPGGYTPAQLRTAYRFNQVAFQDGAIAGDGTGQTVAIVTAYHTPNAASDLAAFSTFYGLPPVPAFTQVNQFGGSNFGASDAEWALETALSVQWTHAFAPGAKILLVEAATDSLSDLLAAVDYARNRSDVSIVTMPWGTLTEFDGQTSFDSYFSAPAGVSFYAPAGNSGGPGSYPAYSPNVVAVGGTRVVLNANNEINSDRAWSFTGGGISLYAGQPTWQAGVVPQTSTWRAMPDIAFNADPSTGIAVFDTFNNPPSTPWSTVGGTSLGAVAWGALGAIANQGRSTIGKSPLDPVTLLSTLYSIPQNNFRDIRNGESGGSMPQVAEVGFDLVSGRGVPRAEAIISNLVGSAIPLEVFLAAASDTGISNSDRITNRNNGSPSTTLQFVVTNTTPGAVVSVKIGETTIGAAIATGTTTTVITNGVAPIADGTHQVVVSQTLNGQPFGAPSAPLAIAIDTTAPVTSIVPVSPDPRQEPVSSITIGFSEIVFGLSLSAIALTRSGGTNLLGGGQTLTSGDGQTWALDGLSSVTAISGAYQLTVTPSLSGVRDAAGNLATNAATSFTVNANAAPTDIVLSNATVPENQPSGSLVGVLSTVDPNVGDYFDYQLVDVPGSTDNGSFTIVGNELRTAASFDYEAKSAYSIRVRSVDQGGLFIEKAFTILVTNVNETPTAHAGTLYAVFEGGSLTLSAAGSSDPDSDPLTYSWDINGDDVFGDAFGVSPTLSWSQLVALGINQGPLAISNLRVEVNDGHGGIARSAAAVLAVLNSPPATAISGPGTALRGELKTYVLTATDPSSVDQAAGFTYTINWGDGSPVEIVTGPSGTVVSHRFNASSTVSVSVTAEDQDGGISTPASQTVQVDPFQLRPNELNPELTDLVWGGSTGNDRVEFIELDPTTIQIRETMLDGVVVNHVQNFTGITGRVHGYAGPGDDYLDARGLLTRQATLDGGGDDNWLYGGAAGDVLIGGSDGGEGQQGSNVIIAGNGSNTIYGNAPIGLKKSTGGNNLIVGGSGRDVIYGNFGIVQTKNGQPSDGGEGGQNLIIGGGGSDTIYASQMADGAEGGHGSILVAGSTSLNEAALAAILTEWTTTRSYEQKIANIMGTGSGLRENGDYFLQPGVTILSDSSEDELFSDTNGELNWLIYAFADDQPRRVKPGEVETDE
jgi:pectate lyase